MSDSDKNQATEDAHYSGHDLHIRDKNGEVTSNIWERDIRKRLDIPDLELPSNLGSGTEIENDIEQTDETSLLGSK